jgi:hypothetical protein
MVQFVIEVKTVVGMQHSQSGCIHEAQVQLIGLNAANHQHSPPVVLTDLTTKHVVLHVELTNDERQPLKYVIYLRECATFPQAVHLATSLAGRACVTADFSRPNTPTGSDEESS